MRWQCFHPECIRRLERISIRSIVEIGARRFIQVFWLVHIAQTDQMIVEEDGGGILADQVDILFRMDWKILASYLARRIPKTTLFEFASNRAGKINVWLFDRYFRKFNIRNVILILESLRKNIECWLLDCRFLAHSDRISPILNYPANHMKPGFAVGVFEEP